MRKGATIYSYFRTDKEDFLVYKIGCMILVTIYSEQSRSFWQDWLFFRTDAEDLLAAKRAKVAYSALVLFMLLAWSAILIGK